MAFVDLGLLRHQILNGQARMISKRWQSAFLLCTCFAGCGQPVTDTGPSYAELVVIYNAELETLDRLEAKREKLVAAHSAASKPEGTADTLSQLEGLLRSARSVNETADPDAIVDPDVLLDRLSKQSGEAQDIAGQLLDGLLGGDGSGEISEADPEVAAAIERQMAELEAELENLDAEIGKQKDRVRRARAARDAAEAELPH